MFSSKNNSALRICLFVHCFPLSIGFCALARSSDYDKFHLLFGFDFRMSWMKIEHAVIPFDWSTGISSNKFSFDFVLRHGVFELHYFVDIFQPVFVWFILLCEAARRRAFVFGRISFPGNSHCFREACMSVCMIALLLKHSCWGIGLQTRNVFEWHDHIFEEWKS